MPDYTNYQGERAIVLLSGGLDSATALAIASAQYARCYALTIDYGQRHGIEIEAAKRIAKAHKVYRHHIMQLDFSSIAQSALLDTAIAVPQSPTSGIPPTYVPARNSIFLALALGFAETVDAHAIVIGVNAVDYAGYPDCRGQFIAAFQSLANVATAQAVGGHPPRIEAPLLHKSKADIIRWGYNLHVNYASTVSCYQASAEGACGLCDSCRYRLKGFAEAGIPDPLPYRTSKHSVPK